jgi:NADH-quinone oxidoreductase subunit D
MTAIGTFGLELGASTVFLYGCREREKVLDLFELISGLRMNNSYIRPGGVSQDLPAGALEKLREFLGVEPALIGEIRALFDNNPVFRGRSKNVAYLDLAGCMALGVTGPILRATGLPWDLRKSQPYCGYETYDFDVPVGTNGDVYDRYLVRMEELRQSVRILEQATARLPEGPINVKDHRVILPPKSKATSDMESMIHHFKQVMEGPRPPLGEVYVPVESPKGEKGYYMVSDGTSKPVRWRIRPPAFVNLSAIPKMVEGHLLSDVIAINASIDIVMGEIDR